MRYPVSSFVRPAPAPAPFQGVVAPESRASGMLMADTPPNDATARIDRALERIEAAAAARAFASERLARRHAVLRSRIEEAVAALDNLIAREERQD